MTEHKENKPRVLISGSAFERRLLSKCFMAISCGFDVESQIDKKPSKGKWSNDDTKNAILGRLK
jgi:hypothetical protein